MIFARFAFAFVIRFIFHLRNLFCHRVCVCSRAEKNVMRFYFLESEKSKGDTMLGKIWQQECICLYTGACGFQLLPVSPVTDFEIILTNGLRHYLLPVTHHFALAKSAGGRISLQQLSAQRLIEEGIPAAVSDLYPYTKLTMGSPWEVFQSHIMYIVLLTILFALVCIM